MTTMPADIATSPRRSGHRVVTDAGVVLAQIGVLSSSLLIWFFSGLTFFGEPLGRPDYLHMTAGFGLGSALLILGFLPARALRCSRWVWVVGAILTAGCLVATALSYSTAMGHSAEPFDGEPWWWPFELFAWLPMSWPMVLLVLARPMVATGRSRPTQR